MKYDLAQVNIAVAKYAYESPALAGFVNNIERINAVADRAPGFVWHYTSEDDAEARSVFADERILFNLSLWESVRHLRQFAYQRDHLEIMRQRTEWFEHPAGPSMALWWQPRGTLPTVNEARHRLDCLAATGPGPEAFTFRKEFALPNLPGDGN